MCDTAGNSIFDCIDARGEVLDRYSQVNVKAFLNTVDIQSYIEREASRISIVIRNRLMLGMERFNETEGVYEFDKLILNKEDLEGFTRKAEQFFDLPECTFLPEDLRNTLRTQGLDLYGENPGFPLWNVEYSYFKGSHDMRALRYDLTDIGRALFARIRGLLSNDAISVMMCGPVLKTASFGDLPGEYVRMCEWVSVTEPRQMLSAVICFRAEKKLIEYAVKKGMMSQKNLEKDPEIWNLLRIRERGRKIADVDSMIPYADNQSVLSEDEKLVVKYREEHNLCLFCGSDQFKKVFITGVTMCAKCKKLYR